MREESPRKHRRIESKSISKDQISFTAASASKKNKIMSIVQKLGEIKEETKETDSPNHRKKVKPKTVDKST